MFFLRGFTPALAGWYKKLKETSNGDNFDIVFVSSDRDSTSFDDYFKEMPWLALPYSQRDKKVGGGFRLYMCIILQHV